MKPMNFNPNLAITTVNALMANANATKAIPVSPVKPQLNLALTTALTMAYASMAIVFAKILTSGLIAVLNLQTAQIPVHLTQQPSPATAIPYTTGTTANSKTALTTALTMVTVTN